MVPANRGREDDRGASRDQKMEVKGEGHQSRTQKWSEKLPTLKDSLHHRTHSKISKLLNTESPNPQKGGANQDLKRETQTRQKLTKTQIEKRNRLKQPQKKIHLEKKIDRPSESKFQNSTAPVWMQRAAVPLNIAQTEHPGKTDLHIPTDPLPGEVDLDLQKGNGEKLTVRDFPMTECDFVMRQEAVERKAHL